MSKTHNENTRVQVPAILYLCKLGYTYISELPEYDSSCNILTGVFIESLKRLNPGITDLECKLCKEIKEGKNKKTQLQPEEITRIVNTFKSCTAEENFSVAVNYTDIIEKNYMISAGYYFEVKIEPVNISPKEFAENMTNTTKNLEDLFAKSRELEATLIENLKKLKM